MKCLFTCVSFAILSSTIVGGLNQSYLKNYGPGYGTDWVFFPDEDGIPHYLNLREDYTLVAPRMGLFGGVLPLDDIEFRLYYGENDHDYNLLDVNAKSLNDSIYFNPNAPVKIITHGWKSSADGNAALMITREYMKTHKYNVITVDWSDIAQYNWYPGVANDTKEVGNHVGKFIKSLCEKYCLSQDKIHLLGHSLGAHVMGNAAVASGLRLGRITGLDPARPFFELPSRPSSRSLDPSDAQFVDVIHTCGGILGFQGTVGHADFFPNGGGAPQPGCGSLGYIIESCSHGRAFVYFAESINHPRAFHTRKCESWSKFASNACNSTDCYYMGDSVNHAVHGKFYLETNPRSMYGKEICI